MSRSLASIRNGPGSPGYAVGKTGLIGLTRSAASSYAADNIRMNALLPGYIDSLDHKPETAETIPMRRIGTVEERDCRAIGGQAAIVSSEAGSTAWNNCDA